MANQYPGARLQDNNPPPVAPPPPSSNLQRFHAEALRGNLIGHYNIT